MTNSVRYLELILATFPELSEKLAAEEGIYNQTHEFVDFANAAISYGDWPRLQLCYEIMDRVLHEEPDKEVYNVVYVAFVEHLDFETDAVNGLRAKNMLTPRLLQAWNELEKHWRESAEQNRKQAAKYLKDSP